MKLHTLNHANRYTGILFTLFTVLFFNSHSIAQQNPSPLLVEARENLPKAFDNEKDCIELYNKLKGVKNPDPLMKGYIGAVNIARSRHAPLLDKRSYLKTGAELLEQAIKEKPNTTELLFLRLTIQINLPSFLGYNDNIDADKKFVLANYSTAPPHLKARISNFVKKSDYFTGEEKALIK
jgi:hypothetical protein